MNHENNWNPAGGGCACKQIRYQLETSPLFVHCCHCRWCQRESGAAFAINAMIESDQVTLLQGTPITVDTPSASGNGQQMVRCPQCFVTLWSHYAGSGPVTSYVRVGTLDNPDLCSPDIHIFTSTRQPWLDLPADTPAVEEFYDRREHWPDLSLARFEKLRTRIVAFREQRDP